MTLDGAPPAEADRAEAAPANAARVAGPWRPARTVPFELDSREGLNQRLDLSGLGLGGVWVTITWRDEGGGGPRLLATLLAGEPDAPGATALVEEPRGGGTFAWTGRLPETVTGIRLTALSPSTPFHLTRLSIRHRSRPALVARALLRAPGLTVRAVIWRALRLRLRGRGLLVRALATRRETGYGAWIRRFDTRSDTDRTRIRAEIALWLDPPLISILMPVHDPAPKVLEQALRSAAAQLYPHWELCVADDASTNPAIPRLLAAHARRDPRIRVLTRPENGHIARATNDALALARGTYAAFLDHDDVLAETALYEVAAAIQSDPGLELIYSDEDKIDGSGRRFEPHFKPDFDHERLFAQNYPNHLGVVRTETLRALGGLRPGFEGSQDHDLLLRLAQRIAPAQVRHIPKVLYHWRAAGGSGTFSDRAAARTEAARLQALREIAQPLGMRAERGPLGFNRLVRPVPQPAPTVCVVIPTRDQADLLATVLDGLFTRTDYPSLEVVVVDNDSREPATRALFARYATEPRLTVLPVSGAFNFSDLSNRGAAAGKGEILLFLNNDVEVTEPVWLAEMVSIACDPGIGAVGAKLLYPDGTLQHGGIVLGIGGVAGHSHLGLPGDDPGYFARHAMAHEVSAVTGACLAMRRCVFAEVGGFDAIGLKVAFNDVDLCLRVRRAGYRIVWTPHASLIHHESKSRGAEDTWEKRARFEAETRVMRERWEAQLRADPYYNPNLSRAAAHFRI